MSGIAGIVRPNESKETILQMNETLCHRGPDDEGYLAVDIINNKTYPLAGDNSQVQFPHISAFSECADLYLAHRRLSITDLTPSAHQPMSNTSGTIWVTYDGELYNYLQIRDELSEKGYVFRTRNDTEVLIAAYEEWGEDCLDHFDGMWSFVLYDQRKAILFGSRDRFGVKPLYYVFEDELFSFASEAKTFFSIPGLMISIREQSVFEYLILGKDHWTDGTTFYQELIELPPSYAFRYHLRTKDLEVYRYYSLLVPKEDQWETFSPVKAKEYLSLVRDLIYNSVRKRLISKLPVGASLSGGIDSTSIVSVVAQLENREPNIATGEQFRTFTACFPEEVIDESFWAKMVAQEIKVGWFPVNPSMEELWDDLKDLVRVQDFPFGSTSMYAHYRVLKLAKEMGVAVLLSGQGGDELFTGYGSYFITLFCQMIKQHGWADLRREWGALGNAAISKRDLIISLIKSFIGERLPQGTKTNIYRIKNSLLRLLSRSLCESYFTSSLNSHFLRSASKTNLKSMMVSLMTDLSLPHLLRYEDRNSMRFQIQSRTPFADDRKLIETVFSIPSVYKIHQGYSKWLLRESLKDILPRKVYQRKDKIGFSTPEYQWLAPRKEEIKKLVCDQLHDYLDIEKVSKKWDSIFKSQPKLGITPIWRLINLALWLDALNW